MPFNDNDFKGFRSQQLKVFCHQVAEIKKTPDLISLVRGEADYVSYCRKITNSDEKSRRKFAGFCRANGLDPNEIQIRVCLVATVLGVYKQADYYGILGIAPDADDDAIKKAYRNKAKMHHPDKRDGAQGRSDEFIELHAAYSHLRDPKLRKIYDAVPEVKGPWVQGSQKTSSSRRRPALGRIASWLCLFIGGMVIFAYAFEVYQNKSTQFVSQLPVDDGLEPEVPESVHSNHPIVANRDPLGPSTEVGQGAASDQETLYPTKIDNGALESVPPLKPTATKASSATAHIDKRMDAADVEAVDHTGSIEASEKTIKGQNPSQPKAPKVSKTKRPLVPKKIQQLNTAKTQADAVTEKDGSPIYIVQKERVLSFLKRYTESYEERDLTKFKAFFTDDAMEQGQPFKALLPKYKKTFKNIKSMEYKIEIGSLSMGKGGSKIFIDGDFKAQFRLVNSRTGQNHGSIRMELRDDPNGLLVTRLDYEIGH